MSGDLGASGKKGGDRAPSVVNPEALFHLFFHYPTSRMAFVLLGPSGRDRVFYPEDPFGSSVSGTSASRAQVGCLESEAG